MAEKYPRNEKPCCSKLGHQNWMQEEEKTETKGKSAKVPFLNYCDQTSLHGWTYLSTEVGLFRKGLWASLVCVSVIVSLFYTHANILEFMNATTITSINTTAAPLR